MKHVLQQEHPILVFEDIDNPKNTVSLALCLQRLKSIANVKIDENEERIIKRATGQRNKIVHHEYEISPDYYRSEPVKKSKEHPSPLSPKYTP